MLGALDHNSLLSNPERRFGWGSSRVMRAPAEIIFPKSHSILFLCSPQAAGYFPPLTDSSAISARKSVFSAVVQPAINKRGKNIKQKTSQSLPGQRGDPKGFPGRDDLPPGGSLAAKTKFGTL